MNFGLKICGIVMLLLISLFMVIGGIVIIQGQGAKGDGCGLDDPIFFGHKGYTVQYQENTIQATTEAIANTLNPEFDILKLSDDTIVAFHDDNAKKLTGQDIEMTDSNWSTVQDLQYLTEIQGYSYNQRLGIPKFQQIVDAACGADSETDLDIDIKGNLTEEYTKQIIDILDNSVCSCNENQRIVLSTPFWFELNTLKDAIKNASKCNKKTLISVWVHPDTYPLAEHFFIKTRMPAAFGKPDIMSFHKLIWQEHQDLIDGYTADGWCTAIYGDFRNELEKYDASGYYVVDTADNNEEVTYDPNEGIYIGFIVLFAFGFVLLLISVILLVKTIRQYQKDKKGENVVTPVESSVGK